MEFSAEAIAQVLKGTVEGDPKITVNTVAKIEEGKPGALSFLSNPKYSKFLYTTESSIVLINNDFVLEKPVSITLIRVANAYESFAQLLNMVSSGQNRREGVHSQAIVEPSSRLGEGVYVGPFTYIGENVSIDSKVQIYGQVYIDNDVTIGENTIIYPGVKLMSKTVIGKNCIVNPGAVIGSDGFGFAPQQDGSYHKIPQIGNVVIEDNVEIGSNTTIDRATMGSTIIRKGAKLDNLIQIAHNVDIGENTVIAAQTGIAGSTKVGRGCMFGGQVGLSGHLTIADGVKFMAQTGVSNHVKTPNEVMFGTPALSSKKFTRSFILFKQLPEIRQEIEDIKRSIGK